MKLVERLAADPYPRGCQKVAGAEGMYRIRWRDYRILYKVENAALLIVLVRIRHRSIVYRRLPKIYGKGAAKHGQNLNSITLRKIEDARIHEPS
jgi:hypothetical protein